MRRPPYGGTAAKAFVVLAACCCVVPTLIETKLLQQVSRSCMSQDDDLTSPLVIARVPALTRRSPASLRCVCYL